jgi:glycosyltransferase involved in cell wall biosynthesis
MKPILSIIIPCYNSELTLEATLESVISQDFQDWEVIIVNDGSIDGTDEIALKWVDKDKRFKYFTKHNEGLGKTRNYGITRSSGRYILPLDSDNQLIKDFSQEAIAIFEKNQDIGVVYGDAEYFGDKNEIWKVDGYNLNKMLIHNYIDACAIYKKHLWKAVGGYDQNMPYQGHEDWEFWIALGNLNIEFHHLNTITFRYFVSKNCMSQLFTNDIVVQNQDYIIKKYSMLYHKQYSLAIINNLQIDKLKSETVLVKTSKDLLFIIFSRLKKRLWKK